MNKCLYLLGFIFVTRACPQVLINKIRIIHKITLINGTCLHGIIREWLGVDWGSIGQPENIHRTPISEPT